MSAEERLSSLLLRLGLADSSNVGQLVDSTMGPIRKLTQLKNNDESTTIIEVAEALKIEYYDFNSTEISKSLQIGSFVDKVDADFCRKHKMVPLIEDELGIIMAFANPLDEDARRIAEFNFAKSIVPVIAEEQKILDMLSKYWGGKDVSYDSRMNLADAGETSTDVEVEVKGGPQEEAKILKKFNIIQIANKILADAVSYNASDIHIEPSELKIEVRYRIDGVMTSLHEFPSEIQPYLSTRMKIISGMNISEKRKPQDGRISLTISGEKLDLRVSSLPNAYGEKFVFRLLRSNTQKLSFPDIGVPEDLELKLCTQLFGRGKLLLVTGPTGSGKTTTLYTSLKYCIDGKTNIQTVEDPVEFQIPGINQIQINKGIGMTFASALRSILRQDPDIIMLGEIRDTETAQIALQAADTGHLVLSTLHTNSAPSAITRLTNLGVEPFQIASCISGVIAQRLVRKCCTKCAIPADEAYLSNFKSIMKMIPAGSKPKIMKPVGCPHCAFTGYKGRRPLYSYLEITPKIQDLIYKNAPLNQIVATAQTEGFKEIHTSALEVLAAGVTSFEEIVAYLPTNQKEETTVVEAPIDPNRMITQAIVMPRNNSESAEQVSSSGGIQKTKILVVDDNPNLRKIMVQMLRKQMFDVREAENGFEALERVYEARPDIVLCDLNMPQMNGKEFLLKIRANPQTGTIPIIMLTDADIEENEVSLLEIGANDFISKSSSYRLILTRIRKICGN